jgi:hypothetical protein
VYILWVYTQNDKKKEKDDCIMILLRLVKIMRKRSKIAQKKEAAAAC